MIASRKLAPGLLQRWPLPYGLMSSLRRDPPRFCLDAALRFGDIFRLQIGPWVSHLLSHPEHIRHVLEVRRHNYPRSSYFSAFQLIVGQTLLSTDDEVWLQQRRQWQPAFHHERMAPLVSVVATGVADMLEHWRRRAEDGKPLDLTRETQRLMLGVAARAFLGADLHASVDATAMAIATQLSYVNYRFTHPFALSARVPTPRNLRFRKAVRTLDKTIRAIIRDHREKPKHGTTLLSLLMSGPASERIGHLTDDQLCAEIRTILSAGHITTALALVWSWHLLSQHPEAERRLRTEVDEVLGDRPPTIDDLPRLSYARMVVEESLRLYPTGWMIPREAAGEDEIGGYHIPARSIILVSPFVMHHHPALWDDPERFDPERFAPERATARSRYAYFPFGGGAHQCIGKHFSLLAMQLVLAAVAQQFRLIPTAGQRVEYEGALTLQPRHPMLFHIAKA